MNNVKNVNKLIRTAVIFGVIGLFFNLLFLLTGFTGWTVGVGVFLGMPILMIGIVLYIIAVLRDLKKHDVLED
jgi:hypothetical protein